MGRLLLQISQLSLLLLAAFSAAAQRPGSLAATGLQCNYTTEPFGMDHKQLLLSWVAHAATAGNNRYTTAFQVQVAATPEKLRSNRPDLWNITKKDTAISQVTYGGLPLRPGMSCYWRVRIWDEKGVASAWSDIGSWTMGLLQQQDWKGIWISDSKPQPVADSLLYQESAAPLFRKEFAAAKKVEKAYLYIASLGYNEVYLNGQKVGDQVLDPAWTDYAKRILYSSYNVSSQVKEGANALGVWLGNGWYNPLPLRLWGGLNLREHLAVGKPAFLLQLNITYTDGTTQTITSDKDWKAGNSHILKNNTYLGERHNMQSKPAGWNNSGFDDGHWRTVEHTTPPNGTLQAQAMPPIKITTTLAPQTITRTGEKKHLVDFGKNFAGVVQLTVAGTKGTTVAVKYGELLYDDSTLNVMTSVAGQIKRKGMGGPGAPDTAYRLDEFILSGAADTLQPRFSYTGFRYAAVSGLAALAPHQVAGMQMHTAVKRTGFFWCSDSLVNNIYQASINTFVSNLHGVQSDCPHRERFGYGGDIAITAPSFLLNFSMYAFYKKTLFDFLDAQRSDGAFTETAPYVGIADGGLTPQAGPIGWGYAVPLLMEALFQYYGDTAIIREAYPGLKRWVDYLTKHAPGGIVDKGISDHESIDPKPVALTGTAFYYRSAKMLARFAALVGKSAEATYYRTLSESIQSTFVQTFMQPDSGKFSIGTQAAQAFALHYGLVPKAVEPKAVQYLLKQVAQKDFHVATGMFGTLYMLQVLSAYGHHDAAWRMVTQKSFPGWGYMIERGATTIWEHWAFSDDTFSHNHPMWGSVTEWLMRYLAGIGPAHDAAAGNKIVVRPYGLAHLDSLRCSYHSAKGTVSIQWKKTPGRTNIYVEVPVNATATISLPAAGPGAIRLSGSLINNSKIVTAVESKEGWVTMTAGSGTYHFEIENKP